MLVSVRSRQGELGAGAVRMRALVDELAGWRSNLDSGAPGEVERSTPEGGANQLSRRGDDRPDHRQSGATET